MEIDDALFERAKKLIAERKAGNKGGPGNATMRDLIQRGLEHVLQAEEIGRDFSLADRSVGGDGPVDGVDLHDWEQIRDLIYDDGSRR